MRKPALAQAVHPDMPGIAMGSVRHLSRWGGAGGGEGALLVVCDQGQLVHILQQNAAALQVEDAVLAPGLELAIDALARRTDEDAKLLLRDMHIGTEIRRQRDEPPGKAHRQRMQHRFFHALALPANALTQQLDDPDRDLGFALEEVYEV